MPLKIKVDGKLWLSANGRLYANATDKIKYAELLTVLPLPANLKLVRISEDASFKVAEIERRFFDLQRNEPRQLADVWVYRDIILNVEGGVYLDRETKILKIKHYVLRQERDYQRIKREVEAFENMERMDSVARLPIPESVRMFVWQRDSGKCVKCGSRELLEFDHIIPVAKGGSSTERNIQLLCEPCNRSKGSTI